MAVSCPFWRQVAANQRGITLLQELVHQYSLEVVQAYMHHVQVRLGLVVMCLCAKSKDGVEKHLHRQQVRSQDGKDGRA